MNSIKNLIIATISLLMLVWGSAGAFAADDSIMQNRLNALEAALSQIGQPALKLQVAVAKVCWSADGSYSPVGVATQTPYGTRGIAACIELKPINTPRTIRVIWTKDQNPKPIWSGDVVLEAGKSEVMRGFVKANVPLSPGCYYVKFKLSGQDAGSGKIVVRKPDPLGKRKVNDLYAQAIKLIQNALNEVDAGRAFEANKQAQKSVPLLANVMFANAANTDAVGANELAQSIIAVGKMNELASKNEPKVVLDWVKRSAAHARAASELIAKNAALKKKAGEMADILDKAIIKIEEVAAR